MTTGHRPRSRGLGGGATTAAASQPHVEAHLAAGAEDRLNDGHQQDDDESRHHRREKGCGEIPRAPATRQHHQHLHLPHPHFPHRSRVVLSVVETPGGHDELLDDPPPQVLPRARRHNPRLQSSNSSHGKKRGRASSAPSLRPFDSPPAFNGATPPAPAPSNVHTQHWFLPAALSLEEFQRVAGCDRSAADTATTFSSSRNHPRRSRSSTSPESPTRPLLHARSQSRSSNNKRPNDVGDGRSEARQLNGNEDGEGDDDDNNNNDDASVASSTAYFEPSDLSPSNWMQAIDAPTFAFGLVALSAAIAHPLLFVAGALAALGTAQAAGAGYDYFNDRPISLVCWRPNLQNAVVGEDDDYDSECKGENKLDDTRGDKATASDSKKSSQLRHPLSHATTEKHPPLSHSSPQPLSPHNVIPDTPTLEQPNHAQLEQWVAQHFPPFDHPLVRDEAFLGLSALEVFAVFFDDHAPYNFVEFQKKRGDINIVYQPWQPRPEPPVPFQSPYVAAAAKDPSSDASCHSSSRLPSSPLLHKQRVVTFKAKTHSLLGPPYASTTKVQRYIAFSKKLAVIDTETTLADIPFGDRFKVYERWIVRADKEPPLPDSDNGGGATATAPSTYNARLSASCQVVFDPTQSCPFEGHIRTKTKSTVHEVATAWCSMAQQALKLAHKAKQERLRQELQSTYHPKTCHPNEDDAAADCPTKPLDPPIEAIEVEHDGDLGIVTLRRSESESLHDPLTVRSRSASQHHPYQHQQLLSLQGFRRSLSHLAKRGGGGGGTGASGGYNNNQDSRSSPPESAAAERRPRKATTLW